MFFAACVLLDIVLSDRTHIDDMFNNVTKDGVFSPTCTALRALKHTFCPVKCAPIMPALIWCITQSLGGDHTYSAATM